MVQVMLVINAASVVTDVVRFNAVLVKVKVGLVVKALQNALVHADKVFVGRSVSFRALF